jgi:protocatechuate 3,4-dioxygenase beta subunit
MAEPATAGGQAGRGDQGGAYRFDIRLRGHKETVFFDA